MCISCGCKQANDDHGDPRNLTMDKLQQAADAAGIPLDEAAKNIQAAAGEKALVGAGVGAAQIQGDGLSESEQSGSTGQQSGSTGGGQDQANGQASGRQTWSTAGRDGEESGYDRQSGPTNSREALDMPLNEDEPTRPQSWNGQGPRRTKSGSSTLPLFCVTLDRITQH